MLHSLLFLCVLSMAASETQPPYKPTDLIFLDCGASSSLPTPDGKLWQAETKSKFLPPNSDQTSSVLTADAQDPSVSPVPYMTARIIHTNFTYKFLVSPGPKFLRFYFYPSTYPEFNTSTSFFALVANGYTLLSNFSAYLTVSALQPQTSFFFKEFIITISAQQQSVDVTFAPSQNSFAFINGIEIVSIPDNLYQGSMDPYHSPVFVETLMKFRVENSTSLETQYRLTVGGGGFNPENDTGMFRKWDDDSDYITSDSSGIVHTGTDPINYTEQTPAYIAPEFVFRTKRTMGKDPQLNLKYNLTWSFSVDSGFDYLIRLHFCETETDMASEYRRVFYIYINNMTAESRADVYRWAGHINTPVYRDYVVHVPGDEKQSKQDLWLQLQPNEWKSLTYNDAVLNGLEIFKLSNPEGSLAGPNPELVLVPTPPEQHSKSQDRKKSKNLSVVIAVVGSVMVVVIASFVIVYLFVCRRRRKAIEYDQIDEPPKPISSNNSSLPTELCRRFSVAEIRAATGDFDDENIIGFGGFGKVYKGYIQNGSVLVAVKRLESSSRQGISEFLTEIRMLSNLRHVHLVSLIGYCNDQDEMILVYEFMSQGTLRDHLYGTKSALPWNRRIEICIGAARGLHYLHSDTKTSIIHRDVKSTNILLDDNLVAKVSDFGLSKIGPTGESETHVSTVVKGSIGYLDPEYIRRKQLTTKSDVYSFGVVLLEVLCARPPVIPGLTKEQVNLVGWVRKCHEEGTLDQIIDPHLKGNVVSASLNKFAEIAMSCVHDRGIERPTISDVAWRLEFALQLQESAEQNPDGGETVRSEDKTSPAMAGNEVMDSDKLFTSTEGSATVSRSTASAGGENFSPRNVVGVWSGDVFSEIINQGEGR